MTFRTRILMACLTASVIPLIVLAAGARHAVRDRLTEQYRESADAATSAVRSNLSANAASIDQRLSSLQRQLLDEPRLRAALFDPASGAIADYAPPVMAATGLDFLLLVDDDGTVLSSGHFRNDYGRDAGTAADRMRTAGDPVLISARRASGRFMALARARTIELSGRRLTLAGGIEVDSAFVSRLAGGWSDAVAVTLTYPGGRIVAGHGSGPASAADTADTAVAETVQLPFIDADTNEPASALWTISYSLSPLRAVTRRMDQWFVAAAAAALLTAYIIARMVAVRVTRPLEVLARNASRVELTRYDAQLATRRQDEVGSLSRLLDRMVLRLRASAQQLRDAERRATVGDMARQVNHDIRNGLVPIRNVIRHLGEVAEQSPADLETVFKERAGTLQGGIGYLENLAANYARLTPRTERAPCDVNALLRELHRDAALPDDDAMTLDLSPSLPLATADPVALRRVVENLTINAFESLNGAPGSVRVSTASADGRSVTISVSDTGSGIPAADLDRVFDDFYTTKERGTGLGLSIVRRLVADMGGRIQVDSVTGRGTTFTIDLPVELRRG